MSEAKLRARAALEQADSASTAEYQRGVKEGYARAIAELSPKIEELAKESAQKLSSAKEERTHQIAAFEAQVAVHAATRVLARAKVSMAKGVCWECQAAPVDPSSPTIRCVGCDQKRRSR